MQISLIIPVHNRQRQLDRALDSVARQDVRPKEVIVVDDASSPPVVLDHEISSRLNLRLVRHEENRGAAAARNTGMRLAECEWLSFLDSDDFLLGDSLSARLSLIEADQRATPDERAIYGCGWVDVDSEGKPLTIRWPNPAASPAQFASGCWFSPGSCIVLHGQAALDAAGGQDEELRRFEDLDWFLALALKGFSVKPLPVAAVAVERNRVQRPEQVKDAANRIREKWSRLLPVEHLLSRLDSYLHLEEAAARYYAGERWGAARSLAWSVARAPRLSLQLSPGWTSEPCDALPSQSLYRPAG